MAGKPKNDPKPRATAAKVSKESPTTTAIVPLSEHSLAQVDDSGRPYLNIRFELRPEGGEFNTDARLTLPRMTLLQSQSAAVKKETRIQGAEEGLFLNTSTGDFFEEFEAVPLFLFQERYYNVPRMSTNMVCTSRDGRGMYGLCLRGNYEHHQIPSRIIRTEEDNREVEVGLCDRCPHAARLYGGQSDCQHVKILVMAPYEFIATWESILPRIEAGDNDPDLVSDIINSMFTLGFRSTSLKAFGQISDQGARDASYFRWSWIVGSTPASNDKGAWHQIAVRKNARLTPDEMIFARSLYKLAQRIRPVITDVESVDDIPTETPAADTPLGNDL
jgi:hypothetical protein